MVDSKANIDIIKLDVEGCEHEIVSSHPEIFRRCKLVHIEKNPSYTIDKKTDLCLRSAGLRHIGTEGNNLIWLNER